MRQARLNGREIDLLFGLDLCRNCAKAYRTLLAEQAESYGFHLLDLV